MSNNQLQTIKQSLMSAGTVQLFKDALPSASGKHAEEAAQRFAKMAYTAIANNPTLQKCSVGSLVKAASMSASLGLDIDARGLAYLVPYGNEAQFQIGYLGLIELAYRSGKVKCISAHCIYESEKDKVTITRIDGRYEVTHPFSYDRPKGNIIAVYATAEVDGFGSFTEVMRIDEIERIRGLSKAKNSPAWKDHYEAMAKKTVIRRLAKFLPKSIIEDFSRAAAIDEQQDYAQAQQNAQDSNMSFNASEPIEANFEQAEPPVEADNTPDESVFEEE